MLQYLVHKPLFLFDQLLHLAEMISQCSELFVVTVQRNPPKWQRILGWQRQNYVLKTKIVPCKSLPRQLELSCVENSSHIDTTPEHIP